MTPPSTIAKIAERLEAYCDAHSLTPANVVAFIFTEAREIETARFNEPAIVVQDLTDCSNADQVVSAAWTGVLDAILSEHNAERKGEG